jgi:hypothetical protein
MNTCSHTKNNKKLYTWDFVDARGIYVAKVCDLCVEIVLFTAVRQKHNPWVWTEYNQKDVDEPTEPTD